MNEVTKIHLGRQAFTISIDAHSELKKYLDEIARQVGDKDVTNEIELRMAELLTERGITANKVVLPADVKFLKAQLGSPKDFTVDSDELNTTDKRDYSKRLFRDTDNAMLAGVAAGLSKYFGLDVLLIRILFVILVFITVGWGLLLYVILWILVPEAKTSSERLQMAGKPVNVSSLKEIVGRADVKGAASRANASLAGPVNGLFKVLLKVAGLIFVIAGLSSIFALIAAETYILVNHATWSKDNIFPIGLREYLLLDIGMVVAALIAVFLVLFGIAMFRRKWPAKTWVTGILVGLVLIGLAVGGALAGDVYPSIRDRYNANIHSTVRTVQPFDSVSIEGSGADINFVNSSSYSVGLSYYDHPNLSNVKTTVVNKTLILDTSQFDWHRNCQAICIPVSYNLIFTVYSPNADQLANQFQVPAKPFDVQPIPVYQP